MATTLWLMGFSPYWPQRVEHINFGACIQNWKGEAEVFMALSKMWGSSQAARAKHFPCIALSLITAAHLAWSTENPINKSREWIAVRQRHSLIFVLINGQSVWLLFTQVDVSDMLNRLFHQFVWRQWATPLSLWTSTCGLIFSRHVDLFSKTANLLLLPSVINNN